MTRQDWACTTFTAAEKSNFLRGAKTRGERDAVGEKLRVRGGRVRDLMGRFQDEEMHANA
jgi:hypothetical protein